MSVSLSNLRKAAVLLRSIDESSASRLLEQLPDEMTVVISSELERLGTVDPAEAEQVLAELQRAGHQDSSPVRIEAISFRRLGQQRQEVDGRVPSGAAAGSASREPAAERPVCGRGDDSEGAPTQAAAATEAQAAGGGEPFGFLREVPLKALCLVVQQEHPRVVSLVLSHLPAERAAAVLESLSEEQQRQIVRLMTTLQPLQPALREEVEQRLRRRVATGAGTVGEPSDGVSKAAQLLNRTTRLTAGKILADLRKEDPSLAERLARKRMDFEGLLGVDVVALQCAASHMECGDLALALKGASPRLRQRCMKLLPRPIALEVKRRIKGLGPVRLGDIEAAQCTLISLADQAGDSPAPGSVNAADQPESLYRRQGSDP